MAVDRGATLKQAEKLLRQGKLDGAIEQYVRLIEAYPEDWNAINALGDLYVRAHKNDLAAEQFTRVGDHQFSEGFFSKAAALYKKALKVKPEDEHVFLQLAEIGERQKKFADVKLYLQKVASQRQARGEEQAAAECILRLGSLEGADLDSKIAAAHAAQQIGDAFRAVELLKEAAHTLEKDKRRHEAFQLMAEAAEIDPFDAELRNRLAREFVSTGQPGRARAYLSAETAGDDPDLLLALATIEFADGKEDDARTAMGRVLALAPDREADVMRLSDELIERGRTESAFACIDAITDAALLQGDVPRAAAVLQKFTGHAPLIPALTKLVAISFEGNLGEQLHQAQAQLADLYLAASRGEDALPLVQALVRADPTTKAHVDRLRRAAALTGSAVAKRLLAELGGGDDAGRGLPETFPDAEIFVYPEGDAAAAVAAPASIKDPASPFANEFSGERAVVLEASEIDLSAALSDLMSPGRAGAPTVATDGETGESVSAPDIEDVFAQMRAKTAREQQASAALVQYEQGRQYLEQGLIKEAIAAFEAAARAPMLRFKAAAQLGRTLVEHGDLGEGVEWLERAAEAPAPTPDEGHELLYDLAFVLEVRGEPARALAVLMELDAEVDGYRDVGERIAHLSRNQGRGPTS